VVVKFGDGRVVVRLITFTGEISGLTALELAGLDVVSSDGNVCAIENVGCLASAFFVPTIGGSNRIGSAAPGKNPVGRLRL
jgi:hypothetical protein